MVVATCGAGSIGVARDLRETAKVFLSARRCNIALFGLGSQSVTLALYWNPRFV